jgi:hypothetical protein
MIYVEMIVVIEAELLMAIVVGVEIAILITTEVHAFATKFRVTRVITTEIRPVIVEIIQETMMLRRVFAFVFN